MDTGGQSAILERMSNDRRLTRIDERLEALERTVSNDAMQVCCLTDAIAKLVDSVETLEEHNRRTSVAALRVLAGEAAA